MIGTELQAMAYGLLAAAAWGSGDFNGGLASRDASTYVVVWVSQAIGGFFLLLLALALTPDLPPLPVLGLGAAAGLIGVAALVIFYGSLARGRMGLIAPLTAVVAAGVPVVVSALLEGAPGALRLAGFVLALLGIWLLAGAGRSGALRREEIVLALVAGLGFALFFVFIDRASEQDLLWPLVAARGASLLALAPLAFRRRRQRRGRGRLVWLMALTGILDAAGNAFFALATRTGRLDVAVVLSSLYPLTTILLARTLLREELDRRQQIGAGATIVAILLIAA